MSYLNVKVSQLLPPSRSPSISRKVIMKNVTNFINGIRNLVEDDGQSTEDKEKLTPGLAEQSSAKLMQSLPAKLNAIDELEDDVDSPPPRSPVRYIKSTSVRRKVRRKTVGLCEESQQLSKTPDVSPLASPTLSQAQRSRSLTHIGCLDDDVSLGDEMEASTNAHARHPLAVSMGDLSRVEQRSRLAKPAPKTASSQEYFSVTMDINDEHVHEYLPAVQGRLLREALSDLLKHRGIDLSTVTILGEHFSQPFLPHCDTGRLAGTHLRLKVKDIASTTSTTNSSFKNKTNGVREKPELQKKPSTGSKSKKGMFFGGNSTEDINEPLYPSSHSSQHSWKSSKGKSTERFGSAFGLFSNPFKGDNEKLEAVNNALDRYTKHGLPNLQGLVTFEPAEDPSVYQLETSWTDVVHNSQDMSDHLQQQQNAIWELLQTEVNYIQQLNLYTNRLKLCLLNLQNEGHLTEINVESIFSNIHEIYAVNRNFWQHFLLPTLTKSRITNEPLNPALMKDGFMKFEQLFSPYTKYCMDNLQCIQYTKEKKNSNELLRSYILWSETQKECDRQSFTHLLVKPMQRLTKYALILKVIAKNTDCEDTRHTLNLMINSVEAFVYSVDSSIRQKHEQERLLAIASRIESYDAVESKDEEIQKILKYHLELDLLLPMPGCNSNLSRHLIHEGDLKLKDATKNSMDVHCFLFTDMFLICKPLNKKGDKVKVVRQPYVVDRLVVQEFKDKSSLLMIYLNEYKVAAAVYTISGSDMKQWVEYFRKAQELYADAKSSIRHPRLGFLSADEEEEFDFPTQALLTARSPQSSQSSLVHSHSGSVDMNESVSNSVSHHRAVSLEFSDMRASSASSDEGSDTRGRTQSLELHNQQPTSPRPERKLAFIKSNSGSSSPNTLSVSYPYGNDGHSDIQSNELSPTSLIVPAPKTLSPTSRSITHPPISPRLLKRGLPVAQSTKPPLIKTKNLSPVNSSAQLANQSGNTLELEVETPLRSNASSNNSSIESDEESAKTKLNAKRNLRTDKRYHTADSIENMKRDKDPSIYKRLSLNYPTSACNSSDVGVQGSAGANGGRPVKQNFADQCTSCESIYSSSGVSSTWSLHQAVNNGDALLLATTSDDSINLLIPSGDAVEGGTDRSKCAHNSKAPEMRLDVSEMKDGISSVQIHIQESTVFPTQEDRKKKMKEFIMNNEYLESSEV